MQCSSPLVDPDVLWSPYWAFGLFMPSVKKPRCSERENFTFSILPVDGSVYFPALVFQFLLTLWLRHQWHGQAGHSYSSQKSQSSLISQQLVVFIAVGAMICPGAAPLVTLYGRINKTIRTKPLSTRPSLMPGTTTSQTVKVICHMLFQRFNSSSRVCWLDYSMFRDARCSRTGLWAVRTLRHCICASRQHFYCEWRHKGAHIRSDVQFNSLIKYKGFSVCMCVTW